MSTAIRERGPASAMWRQCDSCGDGAPNEVGPLVLARGWRQFDLDGEHKGRAWRASVFLCPDHAKRMQAFVDSGGRAGAGPAPPRIVTSEGGFYVDPEWL